MYYLIKDWLKKKVKKDSITWRVLGRIKNIVKPFVKPHLFFLYVQRKFSKSGIFICEDELWMASLFPKRTLDKAIELFNPKTVLALGCGTGKSLDYFLSNGIDVVGVEGSKLAISKSNHPERIRLYNLENELNLGKKFDLVWSFEFVEHVHSRFISNLVNTFSNHSDRIVMSAARPGQGGAGHFNEQPFNYWILLFEKKGYKFNEEKTEELRATNEQFSENILVFERYK